MLNRSQIFILITLIFLLISVISVFIFSGNNQDTQEPPSNIPIFSPNPSSSFRPVRLNPILTNNVPKAPESRGGGVDLSSSLVQNSQQEISKLLPSLPYTTTVKSGNLTADISIPSSQYQFTPWVLEVQIFNVEYQVTPQDPDYENQKKLFLSSVEKIYAWVQSQGVDPNKIIINWGDRLYVREKAEEWLSK